MSLQDAEPIIEPNGFVTVSEPACGAEAWSLQRLTLCKRKDSILSLERLAAAADDHQPGSLPSKLSYPSARAGRRVALEECPVRRKWDTRQSSLEERVSQRANSLPLPWRLDHYFWVALFAFAAAFSAFAAG